MLLHYADKIKQNDPIVLVKPKKHQKCDTRADMTKNMDPTKIAISEVHNIPNGAIAIK